MITVLIRLHPKSWRARYGEEFQALLESEPLTALILFDVLRNAARQQVRAHHLWWCLVAAIAMSTVVEWIAVTANVTDNILWSPDTGVRAAVFAALLLPWMHFAGAAYDLVHQRRQRLR